jgi:hypothetical protein
MLMAKVRHQQRPLAAAQIRMLEHPLFKPPVSSEIHAAAHSRDTDA